MVVPPDPFQGIEGGEEDPAVGPAIKDGTRAKNGSPKRLRCRTVEKEVMPSSALC